MDPVERQQRIIDILRVRPINFGQIHAFQIAVPDSLKSPISTERYQLVSESLKQQKSNLVPVVVRRSEAYEEDQEYEVIHGSDWVIIANENGIERLWAWVFDITDEDLDAFKEELKLVFGEGSIIPPSSSTVISDISELKLYFDSEIVKLKEGFNREFSSLKKEFTQTIENVVSNGSSIDSKLQGMQNLLIKIDAKIPPPPQKININTATADELQTLNKIKQSVVLNIIAYRTQVAPFATLDELIKVDGIGKISLQNWKPYLTC